MLQICNELTDGRVLLQKKSEEFHGIWILNHIIELIDVTISLGLDLLQILDGFIQIRDLFRDVTIKMLLNFSLFLV